MIRNNVRAILRTIRSRLGRRPPSSISGANQIVIEIAGGNLTVRADGVTVFTATGAKLITVAGGGTPGSNPSRRTMMTAGGGAGAAGMPGATGSNR